MHDRSSRARGPAAPVGGRRWRMRRSAKVSPCTCEERRSSTSRSSRRLADALPMRIVPTWLGAHEVPLEFRGRDGGRREYVDRLIHEMLPAVAVERLARFADVFCEPGVFTVDEAREILVAASAAGLG